MPLQLTPLDLTEEQIYRIKATITRRTIQQPVTGCWIWQGAFKPGGYGRMGVPLVRKTRESHILAYFAWKGFPGEGLVLDHEICDNPPCCNPEHLVPKPSWDNVKRSKTNPFAIKEKATHCIHNHEFTEENTYIHPKRGTRHCIQCRRDRDNAAYAEQKGGAVRKTKRKQNGVVNALNEIINQEN